ncbi:MAG: HDOD domain-containing protein [Methylococcaceae bacterium]|jgi:HD-like signal output (HDOD) protein
MFLNIFKKKQVTTAPEKTDTTPLLNKPTATQQLLNKRIAFPTEYLTRLIPIGKLPVQTLQQLPLYTTTYAPGSVIFKLGTYNDYLIYLIKGTVYLEALNGRGQEITEHTLKAHCPLTAGAKHQLTAIAKTEVTVIYFESSRIPMGQQEKTNLWLNPEQAPAKLLKNPFFMAFSRHYKDGQMEIPSLPSVALRLRTALQNDIGINEAVKIISLDPAITAKLIQISNGPLYQTTIPATSCLAAVSRLGLNTTRTIVTSISLRHLFNSQNPDINNRVQQIWKQSLRVSSISQVLATLTKVVTPEQALLAGLVYNIGMLPILKFAETLDKNLYKLADLDACLPLIQSQLGTLILEDWGFPAKQACVPLNVDNWFYYADEKLDLSDIVLLAKYHSQIATHAAAELPLLSTLPAYQKLGDNSLSPDMSLQVLQDAKQQINDAMALFSA